MNPIDLRIIEESPQLICLELVGRLSNDGWSVDWNPLVDLAGEDVYAKQVLIDLSRTTYIDSSGVSWLLKSHKLFKSQGGILVLHSASPLAAQFLNIMRMELALNIAPNEAAARQKVEGHEHSRSPEKPAEQG
ncbi:MAG: STAS domain-containing protein [Planctomycetes bacterium]|nr:STAS domain-containing protein [Planctomycetota bacterium]